MKLYKTLDGIVIENLSKFVKLENENWDEFINDDNLSWKVNNILESNIPSQDGEKLISKIEAPIQSQELWASGVTYLRSKVGRQEESKKAGGGDYYAYVYEAERPELFFKATANRVVGHGGKVRNREDSAWNVPEPELTLMITSNSKIVGYTIGNDMSSRSIEGENPLYLPQAKTYDGCAALGPCIYVSDSILPTNTNIHMEISRQNLIVFEGDVEINQLKRSMEELVSFLYRECSFPDGCLLMTGTGIVPSNEFTLHSNDTITITIDSIGTLQNTVL